MDVRGIYFERGRRHFRQVDLLRVGNCLHETGRDQAVEGIAHVFRFHAVVPDKARDNGRRCVHTDEFNRREREFRFYKRARRWEEENLARFLR